MNQLDKPTAGDIVAIMHTSMGDISIRLFPDKTPKTFENFTTHAKNGYYDGLKFHRVIKDFMIQGGDPEGTGRGGESIWGRPFEDETDVELRNYCGALSMANAGPNTNGSQFFIVTGDKVDPSLLEQMEQLGWPQEIIKAYREKGGSPHLDGGYSIFGQVIAGQEVADAISKVETSAGDKPKEDVVIQFIDVTTYGEWAQ